MPSTLNSPCRKKGYTPAYTGRTLPGHTNSSIVPAHVLAAVLRPAIEKLNNHLDTEYNVGAKALIAERAAPHLGVKPEAVLRRLYDVLEGKCRQVNVRWADATLMALDLENDGDVPELPAGVPAALDRINVRCEIQGITLTRKQKREMAEDLVEWSKLVVHDGYEALIAETPAQRLTVLRKHHPGRFLAAVNALVPTSAEVIELPLPVRVPEEELVAA